MPAPKQLGTALYERTKSAGAAVAQKVGEVGTLKKQRVLKGRGQSQQALVAATHGKEESQKRSKETTDLAAGLAARGGLRPLSEGVQPNTLAATQAAQHTAMAASISALANIAADQTAAQRGVPIGAAQGKGGIVALGRSQLGVPYVWAESNPKGKAGGAGAGFDCSGFTKWAYQRSFGVTLPHMASEQQKMLGKVGRKGLAVGDLVFFNYGRKGPGVADHVGLYIGGGMMIDASSSNGRMVQRSVDWSHFLHGGRLNRRR